MKEAANPKVICDLPKTLPVSEDETRLLDRYLRKQILGLFDEPPLDEMPKT